MAVFVALGAFLMTLFGGWTAQRVTDRRHLVLGLAGGLMLGVVGLDLLPEAMRAAGREIFGVPQALLLFVGGFLVAHLVERLLAVRQASHGGGPRTAASREPAVYGSGHSDGPGDGPGAVHDSAHASAHGATPGMNGRVPEVGLTAAAAMVGHSVMDGIALGAAFQVGEAMGAAVALAVIAHDFADGFNTYTLTSVYGNDRRRAVVMLVADAIAPVLGAASTVLFTLPEEALASYLGFFGGGLLYLAAAEILPEAHHEHPARSTLLCTVLGAAFIWLVVGLAA
ncbi:MULTISPECIES: ZIP family metal transporter [unclassified Streptomyces]|uniref:ZIP family metal transporter n=1 Tax=unclassified Streptomyces TaxID=2593676 RepID=UPI000B8972E8|nr:MULTISPECIES: ZIP family metal transporter [unclassified Streptomyces]MYZ37583.1 ZIP family metal transporter [Streptomyces sp. SID4917]